MKTMIAVPCMDMVHVQFVESLLAMDKPDGTVLCFHPNSLIYDARNLLSIQAIQEGYDRVLWVDSDIVGERDALMRLSADMDALDAPMVTGFYVTRSMPPEPVIYDVVREPVLDQNNRLVKRIHRYFDYKPDSIIPVEGCGFGFVLTRVSLLKEVWDKFGPAFAPVQWTGEDVAFCHRVNLLGHRILCDTSVSLGHVGTMVYSEKLLRHGGNDSEKH